MERPGRNMGVMAVSSVSQPKAWQQTEPIMLRCTTCIVHNQHLLLRKYINIDMCKCYMPYFRDKVTLGYHQTLIGCWWNSWIRSGFNGFLPVYRMAVLINVVANTPSDFPTSFANPAIQELWSWH